MSTTDFVQVQVSEPRVFAHTADTPEINQKPANRQQITTFGGPVPSFKCAFCRVLRRRVAP